MKFAEDLFWAAHEERKRREKHENSPSFSEAALQYALNGGETRFLEKVIRTVGPDMRVSELDKPTIRALAARCYPNCQPGTRRRQFETPAMAIINYASGKRPQRRNEKGVERFLTPEEADALLTAANSETVVGSWDPKRHTLKKIAFMLGSGAGPGETFAVEVGDISPQLGLVRIAGKEVGASKTAFRRRWVAPPDYAWRLMGEFPKSGKAFRSPNGTPYILRENGGGQMAAAFRTVREAAGLGPEVTPYVLRHTWATWVYAQTKDELLLRTLGGWAKKDMAFHYAKLASPDLGERLSGFGWDFGQNLDELNCRVH